jgi:hypothetical protein
VISILLFEGWLIWLGVWLRSIEPAGPTLAEHLAARPQAEERRVFILSGQEYLALFGPVNALPKFPSGPPIYIFDHNGHFVDWTSDMGDDNAFHARWPQLFSGRKVEAVDVATWPGS